MTTYEYVTYKLIETQLNLKDKKVFQVVKDTQDSWGLMIIVISFNDGVRLQDILSLVYKKIQANFLCGWCIQQSLEAL